MTRAASQSQFDWVILLGNALIIRNSQYENKNRKPTVYVEAFSYESDISPKKKIKKERKKVRPSLNIPFVSFFFCS